MSPPRKTERDTEHLTALLNAEDLAADLIQVNPSKGPAATVFRQQSAVNKYNPEGITLLCIGFGLKDDEYMQRVRILSAFPRECPDPDSAVHECPLMAARFDADPTAQHLVQDGDAKRAQFIRENPLALIMSAEHQDALARWTYAKTNGNDDSVVERARELIHQAVAVRRGRRRKYELDPTSIAQAHFDLVAYLRALRECVDDVHTANKLLSYFPDCPAALAAIGSSPEKQLEPLNQRISPPTAAITILGQVVGLKRAQLQVLLKPYRG